MPLARWDLAVVPELLPAPEDIVDDAHEAALAAATASKVEMRVLESVEELSEVVDLCNEVWPGPQTEVSIGVLRMAASIGHFVSGAYDGDELIGMCLGVFAAPSGGPTHLHSHLAAVREGARSRGIGFAVKMHQRAWALERGCHAITWTFDPQIGRNAYFNIERLGAKPSSFHLDFYGEQDNDWRSPSDRLMVTWALDGPLPRRTQGERDRLQAAPVLLSRGPDGEPVLHSAPSSGPVLVYTPGELSQTLTSGPASARVWSHALRDTLGAMVGDGWETLGFTRRGAYCLRPPGGGTCS